MSSPYLSDEEVADITNPLTQGAARCRYFRKLGVKVDPRPNGQPLVGRAEFEAARLSKERSAVPLPGAAAAGSVITPDWTRLRERQERPRRPRAA